MIITDMTKLRAGMVVSQEVIALNGQIILESGTELNEGNIKFLVKNKVEFLEVEDFTEDPNFSEEVFKKMKAEIESNKKKLFQDSIQDKYMKELFRTVCELKFIEMLNG